MTVTMIETGENILISPDLTGLKNWSEGIVIEVENNTFNGIVIAAETRDRNVFFGRRELFKTTNDKEICLQ
jgi:HSP20 family molecular chaperone IbpA